MNVPHVIRTVGHVETPAVGRWALVPGEPVVVRGRSRSRGSARRGCVVDGALEVEDHFPNSMLHLAAAADCTVAPPAVPDLIVCTMSLVDATPQGVWRFEGEAVWQGEVRPARADARYHGVFLQGSSAVAWLGVHLAIASTHARPSRRVRRRTVSLTAELNAVRDDLRTAPRAGAVR